MIPPHEAGEGDHAAGDDHVAPVISLAGARAARRREDPARENAAERDAAGRDGAESDAARLPSGQDGAERETSGSPALTVIENRRPSPDELRALELQVRQIESTPPDALPARPAGDSMSARAARRAENVSMNALARRGQSRAEVADLLARRDLPPEVVDAELDRLTEVGLIDDHALARDLVDRLRSRKKLGASALRAELQRRRLERDAIDAALAGVTDGDADADLVDELAHDRARRLGGLDRVTAERRLVDYLARKGHSGSHARDAARRALDGGGLRGSRASGAGPGIGGAGARRRPVEFQ